MAAITPVESTVVGAFTTGIGFDRGAVRHDSMKHSIWSITVEDTNDWVTVLDGLTYPADAPAATSGSTAASPGFYWAQLMTSAGTSYFASNYATSGDLTFAVTGGAPLEGILHTWGPSGFSMSGENTAGVMNAISRWTDQEVARFDGYKHTMLFFDSVANTNTFNYSPGVLDLDLTASGSKRFRGYAVEARLGTGFGQKISVTYSSGVFTFGCSATTASVILHIWGSS